MDKAYTAFPDIVIEGTLPLTKEIAQRISQGVINEEQGSNAVKINYGWYTDKFMKLDPDLLKLQSLLVRTFYDDIKKQVAVAPKMKIELVRPYLQSIKPEHSVGASFERRRWYNGCIWLQTTNKGSKLCLHAPQEKIYSVPDGVSDYYINFKPETFKYIFWPSHLSHSFTVNESFIDTVLLQFTFTGAIPGVPGPGK